MLDSLLNILEDSTHGDSNGIYLSVPQHRYGFFISLPGALLSPNFKTWEHFYLTMPKEKLPAIHIYPGDWYKDQISGCSIAAQGLWLRLMFIMHDSEPYGHIKLNPNFEEKDILPLSRRCGVSKEEFFALFLELVSAGVPSKSEFGIYSRRMVRDAEIRQIRSKSGKKGGRPPSKEHIESKDISKIKANDKAKTKQNTEDEDEDRYVVGFDSLWSTYPRRLGYKQALKHFKMSVHNNEALAKCKQALGNYINHCRGLEEKYIQHGSTWFNNWKDWVDYVPKNIAIPSDPNKKMLAQGKSSCHEAKVIRDDDDRIVCSVCRKTVTAVSY